MLFRFSRPHFGLSATCVALCGKGRGRSPFGDELGRDFEDFSVTFWGDNGIGSSVWREAEVVLFGELKGEHWEHTRDRR